MSGCFSVAAIGTATSLQIRKGERLLTDGPLAETREQLGIYFMINAGDLDEAIGIAEQIPAAHWGTVEIRPIVEIEGLPENLQNEIYYAGGVKK